jgi:hypothetical protein
MPEKVELKGKLVGFYEFEMPRIDDTLRFISIWIEGPSGYKPVWTGAKVRITIELDDAS